MGLEVGVPGIVASISSKICSISNRIVSNNLYIVRGTFIWAEVLHALCMNVLCVTSSILRCPYVRHGGLHSIGTLFTQVLVNNSEHISVCGSSPRISLPVFFCTSSGLTVANPVRQINVGLFVMEKRHLYSPILLCACHRTHGLHCLLCHVLPALSLLHEHDCACAHLLHSTCC